MTCPDELTLDLWLADALPASEAATVAQHVATCAACAAQQARWHAAAAELHAALELDEPERAYLASLDLAARWRTAPTTAPDAHWGWLALLGVVAAFLTWAAVAQPFGLAVGLANQVGLGTVLATNALGLLLGAAGALIDLSTNRALGLSQPLLALLALAILFWPRIRSAPHQLYGVRS